MKKCKNCQVPGIARNGVDALRVPGDNGRPSMESPMPVHPMSSEGRLFAAAAIIEAITWSGLLMGMWLKYGADGSHMGVWLFGRLHGAAFLFYLATTFFVGARLRWPAWALLLALLAAIPPLVTVPLEIWFRRSGRLAKPQVG